jgi:hypothetical protein
MLFTTVCQSISPNSKMALLDVAAFTIPEYSNGRFGNRLRYVIEIAVVVNEYQSGSYQPLVPACTADASRATTFHLDFPSRILSPLTITLSNVSYISVSYLPVRRHSSLSLYTSITTSIPTQDLQRHD